MSDLVGNPEDRFSRVAAQLDVCNSEKLKSGCRALNSVISWIVRFMIFLAEIHMVSFELSKTFRKYSSMFGVHEVIIVTEIVF